MRGDIDLREIKLKKVRFSRRNLTWLVVILAAAAAFFFTWRYLTHPPRPWLVRWKLDRYLRKEAHARTFKVDFPFPSKAEMAKSVQARTQAELTKGSRTGSSSTPSMHGGIWRRAGNRSC